MKFNNIISSWDEGVPIGNGTMGCLIWGAKPLKFSIDRVDLWDTTPSPLTLRKDFNYENMIELLEEGKFDEFNNIFDKSYSSITPTKILGGRIEIEFQSKIESVEYSLNVKKPIGKVILKLENETASVKSFIYSKDNIGIIKIKGTKDFKIKVVRPNYGKINDIESDCILGDLGQGSVNSLKYPEPEYLEGKFNGFIQKTNGDLKYALLSIKKETDGETVIIYALQSGNKNSDFKDIKEKLEKYADADFSCIEADHLDWWRKYYDFSDIKISNQKLQRIWDNGNYLLACVSRQGSYPMPLQGVFTADCGILPPWKGDYHNDTNTQMSYYSYLKANHLEQGKSFVDFIHSLVPEFKKFAKNFYCADNALNVPGVMTIEGKPMGGWAMYSLSITTGIWICKSLEDYYKYTLDEVYFKDVLYPFMKGVELCIRKWLVKRNSSEIQLRFSSSPEWKGNSIEACFLKDNTNYDLQLLHYLYERLVKYSEKTKDTDKEKYKKILSLLPDYYSDETGYLISKNCRINESHRHFSHLMALYPLRTVKYEGKYKEIIINSIKQLEKCGMKYWVGFSFPWMAQLYTIIHNGNKAENMLELFLDTVCLPNGFHCNGDYKNTGILEHTYRPFTLEANMSAMDAIQEMLLYGVDGKIKVFPALSDRIRKNGAEFKDLRVEGAALVSSAIINNRVKYIKVKALKKNNFEIILPRNMECKTANDIEIKKDRCFCKLKEKEIIILE